jgi:hypothetical protein
MSWNNKEEIVGLYLPEVSSAQLLGPACIRAVSTLCLRLVLTVIIQHYETFEVHEYTTGKGRICTRFVVENVELVEVLLRIFRFSLHRYNFITPPYPFIHSLFHPSRTQYHLNN